LVGGGCDLKFYSADYLSAVLRQGFVCIDHVCFVWEDPHVIREGDELLAESTTDGTSS